MADSLGIKYLDDILEKKSMLDKREFKYKSLKKELEEKEKLYDSLKAKQEHDIKKEQSSVRRGIEDSYNKEIDSLEKELKGVNEARASKKEKEIRARVLEKNKDLINSNKELNDRIDILSKKHNVKIKSNSKFYFMFLVPRGIKESLIAGSVIFVALALMSELIHFFASFNTQTILYFLFALLYAGFFVLRTNYVSNNMAYLIESRKIYNEIDRNTEIMNKNEVIIRKDKDESLYNLEAFDEDIKIISNKIKDLKSDMANSLAEFEKLEAPKIEKDIKNKYINNINQAKEELISCREEVSNIERNNAVLSRGLEEDIIKNLGKEYTKINKIKDLKKYMQTNGIDDIIEALDRRYNE